MHARDLLYPLEVLRQLLYLPKTVRQQRLASLSVILEINKLVSNVADASSHLEQHNQRLQDYDKLLRDINNKVKKIERNLNAITQDEVVRSDTHASVNNTISDNPALDTFYKLFEDRFRGTEDDIKTRVSEYKSFFDALPKKTRRLPIVDIGCGRGEFLAFAKDNRLKAIGIDMNHDMVAHTKSLGFAAHKTDAVSYIASRKTASIAAVTGFHIVEHIPFDSLMKLFKECHRSLTSGGFVLFETPNPKNLIIGSSNFYLDPSHIKPIPPELLSFALESVGFKAEVILKHPAKEHIEHSDKEIESIMQAIYGPQDYAVLAKKT